MVTLYVLHFHSGGTTFSGGSHQNGSVFEVAAGSGTATVLASFDNTDLSNGNEPNPGLAIDSSGNIYGTTMWGGAKNDGTIFEIVSGSLFRCHQPPIPTNPDGNQLLVDPGVIQQVLF